MQTEMQDKKVISLKKESAKRAQEKQARETAKYLRALTFGQLMSESKKILEMLKSHQCCDDIALQAVALVNECNHRLAKQSSHQVDLDPRLTKNKEAIEKRLAHSENPL